jgi:hypothetical protein
MNQEQAISSAIAFAVVNNPDEMVGILSRNGVIVPTETLNTRMLVGLMVNGLAESRSIQNDFLKYLGAQAEMFSNSNGFDFRTSATNVGATMQDGSFLSGGSEGKENWGKYAADLIKGGFQIFQGVQNRKTAQDLAQAEADRLEAERLRGEGSSKTFAQQIALGRLSTTRVIVFGLIGVAVIGTAIYFFTRKKA